MRLLIVMILTFLTSIPTQAENKDSIFLLNSDESLLHISATESREVSQDLLIAKLQVEIENRDINTVQNDINTLMSDALEIANAYSEVRSMTQSYNVYQFDRNQGRKGRSPDMIWKGYQTLILKSKNADALLELSGKIQGFGFIMRGLNYTLSNEQAAEIEEELLESALYKLSARAQRAASALGKSTAELKEINANRNTQNHQPVYARARMKMEMAADTQIAPPVASPGETTVSLSVTAKAILR